MQNCPLGRVVEGKIGQVQDERGLKEKAWAGAASYDIANRLRNISKPGDPRERLAAVIPWELFRPLPEPVYEKARQSDAGRKPFDLVLMFKLLVLPTRSIRVYLQFYKDLVENAPRSPRLKRFKFHDQQPQPVGRQKSGTRCPRGRGYRVRRLPYGFLQR